MPSRRAVRSRVVRIGPTGKEARRWHQAYRKALRQFGHKAQAERIAWAAIDVVPRPQSPKRTRVGKRAA